MSQLVIELQLEGTKGQTHLIACCMEGWSFPIPTASHYCRNWLMQPRSQAKSRCTTWRCMHSKSMQAPASQPAKLHVIVDTSLSIFGVTSNPSSTRKRLFLRLESGLVRPWNRGKSPKGSMMGWRKESVPYLLPPHLWLGIYYSIGNILERYLIPLSNPGWPYVHFF